LDRMQPCRLAISAFLLAATSDFSVTHISAFTPTNFLLEKRYLNTVSTNTNEFQFQNTINNVSSRHTSQLHGVVGGDQLEPGDEDEDEDEDDDDEEEEEDDNIDTYSRKSSYSTTSSLSSTFADLKLDPDDPNPPIKPRPGRFGFRESLEEELLPPPIPDDQLAPTMTREERKENLKIMRQIKKYDLADLRMRKDHAGWVDANSDLKKRERSDPWFGLNERCREAWQIGEMETVEELKALMEKVGGAPPGVKVLADRGYALYTDIYDIGITPERAASQLQQSIIDDRSKRGRAMIAERKKNEELEMRKWKDTMINPGDREEKEGKERREQMMRRLLGELDDDRKKREETVKKMLGELPQMPGSSRESLDEALDLAKEDVKRLRRLKKQGYGADSEEYLSGSDVSGISSSGGGSAKKSSAARAREAAEVESSGGRPRLPGDADITRGEISLPAETPADEEALSSSSTTSGPLTVQVASSYNTEQSDPPMRKHCFQYTIRIVNNSEENTVQLLSRRFEIQTVGSSKKDIVQGEGVTGRQPILAPGEVFEYTSTAPLSVRPIGTTIIAARMKGEYRYVTLKKGQDKATEEQVKKGGDDGAVLGTFHFIFPAEQRVKPIRPSTDYDDEDDEDDDDDDASVGLLGGTAPASNKPMASADPNVAKSYTAPTSASSPPSPASTLPGDSDMSSGNLTGPPNDSSDEFTSPYLRVQVTSTYRPERSDPALDKHCFAYSVRITNAGSTSTPDRKQAAPSVQLVSRRFEIQTIGSDTKDVVQGPGVTGRQPILKPGESFEYTSTAPLSVRPMRDKTGVVARMEGEYSFVVLDESSSGSSKAEEEEPLKAKMGMFHFVLPDE